MSTDYSSLTNNTTVAGGSGKPPRYDVCPTCRLFHPTAKDKKCPFWDEASRRFKISAFLKHRSVRMIGMDGKSTVSPYWIKKLNQWAFPQMRITADADKAMIIKDLKDAAAKMPLASRAEIEQFAKDSQKYVAMAVREDSSYVTYLRTEVDSIVNAVALSVNSVSSDRSKGESRTDSTAAKAARKAKKDRRRERERAKETDSDSDSDDDASSDSSESI